METKQNTNAKILVGDLDADTLAAYLKSPYLAVDTETMGLQTHRDRLCLVQMCDVHGQVTLVRITGEEAPRLRQLMEAPAVLKIFHYARFDVAALKKWLAIEVAPLYCTKIASRLCRTYTDQHGLKSLVAEFLRVEMDKQEQTSHWCSDTLTPAQIQYAAADVIHLIALREKLEGRLAAVGRQEMAHACMAFLPTRAALDLAGWPESDIFAHS